MKELQKIREKYSSAGDLIFRSAMNYLAVCGSAAVANTPIGDPDTPEGRMIECAKEILILMSGLNRTRRFTKSIFKTL